MESRKAFDFGFYAVTMLEGSEILPLPMNHESFTTFPHPAMMNLLCLGQFQLGTSPPATPGISSKSSLGGWGRDLTFEVARGREFDKGGDFVEIQSERICSCIGFISDKYRVFQDFLKNGKHYILDFQFKLR